MIIISKCNCEKNYTPEIISELSHIKNGETLFFEKGTYHFFEEGAFEGFFAPTNNETGIKRVAFPLIGLSDITIDGNGSTFVFHGRVSPFIIQHSKNITIKNITLTTYRAPYALLQITEKSEEKFSCRFDSEKMPCKVSDGNLAFLTDSGELNTKNKILSFHALSRVVIRYMFSVDCKKSRENLPAPYMNCRICENNDTVDFYYADDGKAEKCVYDVGELISINLEENRLRDGFFLEDSQNVVISDINIRRGGGMGVIAQLCENVEISNLRVKPEANEPVTLTADILHFVNCSGKLSIHDCEFESSLDDACNIHGNYTVISDIADKHIDVEYKHEAHSFLEMYKPGDVLTVIDNTTLDELCTFEVSECSFTDDSGMKIRLVSNSNLPEGLKCGYLVENPLRMPDVHIYNNKSTNIPHWRISGAGNILVENNYYDDCGCPVYAYDLAQYWYESGRIKNLTIKNNTFKNARYGDGFVITGVSGYDSENAPLIHENITITDNVFDGFKNKALTVAGFRNKVIKNNIMK
ncbi:MAG: hypothetical protein E7656_00290 [Ruminococcaceae bacterium]|nr:hypothetical protein [Oscillospiraceae bacterium]